VTPPPLDTLLNSAAADDDCRKDPQACVVRAGEVGVASVKPGDALFAVADVRFSHEYVTPDGRVAALNKRLVQRPRDGARISVRVPDHLTFLSK